MNYLEIVRVYVVFVWRCQNNELRLLFHDHYNDDLHYNYYMYEGLIMDNDCLDVTKDNELCARLSYEDLITMNKIMNCLEKIIQSDEEKDNG